jgi:hypothetical protein
VIVGSDAMRAPHVMPLDEVPAERIEGLFPAVSGG